VLPKEYEYPESAETLAELNPEEQLNQLFTMEGMPRVEINQLRT